MAVFDINKYRQMFLEEAEDLFETIDNILLNIHLYSDRCTSVYFVATLFSILAIDNILNLCYNTLVSTRQSRVG